MAFKDQDKFQQIRTLAENDLEAFIKLVHPNRVLGRVHQELIRWWTRSDAKDFQLTLLPRDHQKSSMIAYRVAWEITRNPAIRIMYVSSTSNLAEKQIKFIKDILTSPKYKQYWPEMVHPEEAKREKWSIGEFSVDHPKRKEEHVRDSTVYAAGLTTSITGLHCDIAVLDDVVVYENAYTEEGREKVQRQYSFLASIESADAKEWTVGTRYHPKDLYDTLINKTVPQFNEDGEIIGENPLYETFERAVEDRGDGTGEFLWARQQRGDGKWYGFNREILAQKKAQYLDVTQFYAQYYNNPNSQENAVISSDLFQYYDPKHLSRSEGRWTLKGRRLNVFAGVDFAYTLNKKSDYTSIVIVGIDGDNNYYVLEVDRFKTDKISEYFSHILRLHQKWDFRKIRAEVTSAQEIIVKDLKENYIKQYGLALAIDPYRPNRHQGSKEERMMATLQPRYANLQMYHYPGGNCSLLEEELVLLHPSHDDIKDCLASVIDICVAPTATSSSSYRNDGLNKMINSRFGGIGF